MCSWVSFMMLVMCFSFNGVSYARHHRKQPHPASTLVGTVYCDTCFPQQAPKSTHFISGATVAVECGDGRKQRFREEVKTNENGDFEAKLPVSVGKSLEKIKGCSVRLISSGKPFCSVAATATSSEIRYKSKKAGTHVFSAGFFTFKPELCDQKDFTEKNFPPSLPDPPAPFLPPIGDGILPPHLPIPPLVPPLPRLPGVELPLPPITLQKPSKSDKLSDQKTFGLPPNPFKPPSLTPSTPAVIPPLLTLPPLVPSLLPPILGLVPSSPPPAFPIPLPGSSPIPGFPPVQPARKTTP
ncbi:hypothetical protein L1987_65987 [Smallanthus sonchifolius]|uniref:Uncharacterized protein n=1 Tax=Smallanthus sonchifolius TaxID=185202 RepID=A0ACB9BW47_9ASTR|nr:hypothetical protein L1987_65987 [Smallanthus sonchifolius]